MLNETGRFDPLKRQAQYTLAMRDPVEVWALAPLLLLMGIGNRAVLLKSA